MNLFDIVDGLFEGLVYFGYNVFRTFFTLLIHPFRGPVRLFVAREDSMKKQIGGQTALLLGSLAVVWWASQQGETFQWGRIPPLPTSPDLPKVRTFWPVFVTAFFVMVTIDVTLRSVFSLRYRQDKFRRHMFLTIVEYASSGIPLAILLIVSTLEALEQREWINFDNKSLDFVLLGGAAIVFCTYGLASPGYLLGRSLRGKAFKLSSGIRGLTVKVLTAAICIPLIIVALVPTLVDSRGLYSKFEAAQSEEHDHPQITAAGHRCTETNDGRLNVQLGLANDSDRVISIDADKVNVVLGTFGTGTAHNTFDYFDDRVGFLTAEGSGRSAAFIRPHNIVVLTGTTIGLPNLGGLRKLCAPRLVDAAAELKGAYTPIKPASELFFRDVVTPHNVTRVGMLCDGKNLLGLAADESAMPTARDHHCGK